MQRHFLAINHNIFLNVKSYLGCARHHKKKNNISEITNIKKYICAITCRDFTHCILCLLITKLWQRRKSIKYKTKPNQWININMVVYLEIVQLCHVPTLQPLDADFSRLLFCLILQKCSKLEQNPPQITLNGLCNELAEYIAIRVYSSTRVK